MLQEPWGPKAWRAEQKGELCGRGVLAELGQLGGGAGKGSSLVSKLVSTFPVAGLPDLSRGDDRGRG